MIQSTTNRWAPARSKMADQKRSLSANQLGLNRTLAFLKGPTRTYY